MRRLADLAAPESRDGGLERRSQPTIIGSVTRPGAGRPEVIALISRIPAPISTAVIAAHAASTVGGHGSSCRLAARGPAGQRRCPAHACLGGEHRKVLSEIDT